MRQFNVTIRVFSDDGKIFIKSITFFALNLLGLNTQLFDYADKEDINFDIVSIHVCQNFDYRPLPF